MDHPSYCAGTCKGTAMQTASSDWLCMDCGLSLEARKARQRKVVMPLPRTRQAQRAAAMQRHPASGTKPVAVILQELQASRKVTPKPVPQTVPCTTCEKGEIGQARWDDGHRSCTQCKPLLIAAIGINKAAPALMLLEQATPEQVAGGRRRP